MHHDRFRIRADDVPDFVANANWHVPPAFGPRPYTTRGPDVGVLMQSIVSGARHRPETVRDQVDRSFEDRKLRTPFKKVVSQDALRLVQVNLSHCNLERAGRANASVKKSVPEVVSEFRFVCFRRLYKNDPRNHTKSHEQSCFVWLRGSFSISSQSLKIRKLRHLPLPVPTSC